MATRSFNEIVIDLITYILRKNSKIDVTPGQVIRDVLIDAPADQMAQLYQELDTIRTAQSLLNANQMSTADMDNLASNYGIIRKSSVSANGTVTFYSVTQPTSDFEIPAGTRVSTQADSTNNQIIFRTTSAVKFIAALEANAYNPDNGYWEIQAPVSAENGGTSGNVGPNSIVSILNFDSPFRVVNNISMTGGSDQESNVNLAARVLDSFTGNNKGTKNGYEGTIRSQAGVLDALVQGPGDPLMVRDGGQGGKVDIWTYFASSTSVQLSPDSDTTPSLLVNWNDSQASLDDYNFILPGQPMVTDAEFTVYGTTGPDNPLTNVILFESRNPAPSGIPYVSAGDYHYTIVKNNNLNNGQSVLAQDKITWNPLTLNQLQSYPSGVNTGNNLQLAITYSFNQTINDLQAIIDDPNNKIITADILVKQAIDLIIDIQMTVSLLPAYLTTNSIIDQTTNNVIAALTNYVNSQSLGSKIEKADLVQVAHNVDGVDNIVLNSITITRRYDPLYDVDPLVVENIQAGANEFFSAGNIKINILRA